MMQNILKPSLSIAKNLNNLLKYNFSAAITLEEKNRIAYLTLSNPKKRNILKLEVIQELDSHLENLQKQFQNKDQNPDTFPKCIVIQSEGKVFSAGHDLKEIDAFSREEKLNLFNSCGKVMAKIQKHPLPVIASIQGLATAAGCQLVASCDLAIGSEISQYQAPGVKIGLFCTTPGVAIARSVTSQKKAFEMLATGDPISAQEAIQYGLINKIVKLEDLEQETEKFAQRITCHSAETIALGKEAFYIQSKIDSVDSAYEYASEKMTNNLYLEDCQNGVKAFTQKQHPKFKY